MTLVMAIVQDGMSYIASDSLGSDGFTKSINKNRKIFLKDTMLIGGSGSFKQLQLIEHSFISPDRTIDESTYEYMYKAFVPELTNFLKINNVITHTRGVDSNDSSEFVFVLDGTIFVMQSDLSLLEPVENFACIGSGQYHALAVLKALKDGGLSVDKMLKKALDITVELVVSVGGKLHTIKTSV